MTDWLANKSGRTLTTNSTWFGETSMLPLCAFRSVLGLVLTFWYVDLLPDFKFFFSESGAFPHDVLLRERSPYLISLLDWTGSDLITIGFFLLGLLAAVCLLLGWHSRIAAVTNFVVLVSLQNRNLLPWDGADNVIRVTSFWLIFCPIERAYSIDALQAMRRGCPFSIYAPALGLRMLQLQIGCVYLVSAWAKLHGLAWLNGGALYYALNMGPAWNRSLAPVLSQLRLVVLVGTVGTLLFEVLFLPLVFSPWGQPWLKLIALIWGTAFHVIIALTLKLGWFSYVMVGSYVLFVEPAWIERFVGHLKPLLIKPVGVLFRRLSKFDDRVDAFLSIFGQHLIGRRWTEDLSRLRRTRTALQYSHNALLITLFSGALWFALDPTSKAIHRVAPLPPAVAHFIQSIGLRQSWQMFSPHPYDFAGYVVVEGDLSNGSVVNLQEAGYAQGGWKPMKPYYAGWYYSRWTQIFNTMIRDHIYGMPNPYLLPYADNVCRSYNSDHSSDQPHLQAIRIIMARRDTALPGVAESGWRNEELIVHKCF
jgi:vitamin K-dependent gamma-carboxylase-like protein